MLAIWVILAAFSLQAQTAQYYVAFLRPEPVRKTLTKEEGERIQAAHMANILKMAKDGVLVAAGPFEDEKRTISGVFVFKMDSLKAARELAAQDPTVLEHRNSVDVHTWMGPPGLGEEYRRLHDADPKTPENMQPHPLVLYYRGPQWNDQSPMLKDHIGHITHLKEDHKLGAAGGVSGEDDLAGIVIYQALAPEEAQRLTQEDPAVKGGLFRVEYHKWWSSDHVLPW